MRSNCYAQSAIRRRARAVLRLVGLLIFCLIATEQIHAADISGTVYEDTNYGGGAGRTLAASSGVVRSGITVELYNSAGTYISSTTTNVSGVYTFSALAAGNYIVRVINPLTSSRGAGAVVSVQTYRTDASSGTAVAVTDRVGGQTPGLADAGVRVTTLAALTTATLTPQSITSVTLGGSNITGVDFGYSFNVVVNKNNTGQGSLRRFILNANTLPNTGLAQSGLTAGIDNAVYMLADGTARPGLTASYATQFVSGIATIALTSTLATISNPVILDASLQPGYVGTPMIELNGAGAGASITGLTISAGGSTVRGFIINRFQGLDGMAILTNGNNTITGNYIGTNAAGTVASANTFAGINVGSDGNTIGGTTAAARNILSGNGNYGIYMSGNNNVVQGNYIGTNVTGTAAIANSQIGVALFSVTGNTIGGTAAGAGNLISGNLNAGLYISAGGSNIVQGNYIGTNAAGTAAIANLNYGIRLISNTSANTIGGTTAGAGNVISGNGDAVTDIGLSLYSSDNNTVKGNYIGTNAAGTAALGNTGIGISMEAGSANNTVGGTTAGERNTISGNTQYGVHISDDASGTTGNIVQGNYIGRNATNTGAIAGHSIAAVGILASSVNSTIGGTAAGAGNIISGNSAIGITIAAGSTGNAILSNSIYSNTGIGIDLAAVAAANNGTKTSTLANYGMDSPVFTSASLSGTTLTLAGYVGSAAGQSTFAGATVQVFKSDNDASTYGEGQTFLGTLTADASGNLSGTLTVSGLVGGDKITGTATDATNNTSEFGLNATVTAPAASITGTVFEDKNYGGGAGRTLAASSGVVRSGVTVELYNSAGTYISNTTTNVSGVYTFAALSAGNYIVRVINPLTSSRGAGALVSVQTYQTDASSGAAVAVTDRVGGETPSKADAGVRVTTLAALTTATLTPQSITSVTLSGSNITGVDFGYSFNVIVNKNNTAQGSLRQFITNANTLPNAGLAQTGMTAAIDNAVFMLADGTARPGLTASYATQFVTGIATIAPTSTLATISDPVILDASLQPGYAGTPMIELNGVGAGASIIGLTISAGSSTVRGFIINRFQGLDGIDLITNGGNTITGNYIGTNAAGTAASANTYAGINISSSGNTIGGTTSAARNIISGNGAHGVYIGAYSNNIVQGNYIGLNAAGTAAIANSQIGVALFSSTSNTIGGTSAGARNIISGNGMWGVWITSSGNNNTLQGNYIGTDPAGTAAIPNLINGVRLVSSSSGNTIGGGAAGAGNVISGNGSVAADGGISIDGTGTNSNIVKGNYIGTNAAGTAALANTGKGISIEEGASNNTVGGTTAGERNIISGNTQYGVYITDTGAAGTTGNIVQGNYIGRNATNTGAIAGHSVAAVSILANTLNSAIGGTAAGAGNIISGNSAIGVNIAAGSTGNAILSNSFYANTGIGIDLAAVAAANNGTKSAALANYGMDSPVFTTASLSGTTLTLVGYVGSAAGQSVFAGATVQVFKSDLDATGFGEGQTFLGTLTTDASGNLSGTLTVSGLVAGDKITGTATDATNNTSEFGANATVTGVATYSISGTVFEDKNYGGGSGRSLASSSGTAVPSARVELYTGANYTTFATTDASGNYSFPSLAAATYTVRVVNGTVNSSRTGTEVLPPVQTYRTNASSGTAVAVTDRVGGEVPASVDAGDGSTTLAALTVGAVTPQSITSVVLGASNITGVEFGYSYNVIVNKNNTGQGSLRQFLLNANALSNTGLAQSGLTAGIDNAVFMLADGTARPGLTASYATQFTAGIASITLASELPTISDPVILDASLQPGYSSVPMIELNGNAVVTTAGLTITAGSSTVRGFIINRITGVTGKGINLITNGGNTITGNYLGTNAAGTAASANGQRGISITSANNTIGGITAAARNIISGNAHSGVYFAAATATGNIVQGNYIGTNVAGTAAIPNIYGVYLLTGATNNTIGGTAAGARNVISGNTNNGVVIHGAATTGNIVQGNYIGTDAAGTAALANGNSGLYVFGAAANNTIGGTAAGAGNLISGNTTQGILIEGSGTTGNPILSNSIYANTGIGIDLANDGVTANNGTKLGTLPNFDMDHPVFTTANLSGTTLTLAGYVGSAPGQALFAGATVQVFKSDLDATGFGEGQTFLGTLTTDASGNLSGTLTVTLAVGDKITGTAMDGSNNTSEFGANATVANPPPDVSLVNSVTPSGTQPPGTDLVYTVAFTNGGGQAAQVFIVVDPISANTDFKLGSPSTVLGTTGMTVAVEYSNDNAATWTYTPVSGGGGAMAGYDRAVTNVRWRFTGNLSQTSPNNTGSVSLTARIR